MAKSTAVKKKATAGGLVIPGLELGKGASRSKKRIITIYGPGKSRKTGTASTITGAKWMISDSNSVPTLEALDRLPPDGDLYEVNNLDEARTCVDKFCEAGSKGHLDQLPAFIADSITALFDFHQQDTAGATGQAYMGQNNKDNGWQKFNAEFGSFIDLLAELGKYTNVVIIGHSKEKSGDRGSFHGVALSPEMARRLERTTNWLLYKTCSTRPFADGETIPPYGQVEDSPAGKILVESILYTKPVGLWPAAAGGKHLLPLEPGDDLAAVMAKEGLL